MSSTLPLPPKPDFEALPRPPPDRPQRSPRKSPPPRSHPPYGNSYHPHEHRPRCRNSRGPSRFDSDVRARGAYRRDDRRYDARNHEPDRRDYDYRRDYGDRSRDYDNGRDRRGFDRDRDHEKRDYDRTRDQRDQYDRGRRYDPRNGPPRRRSRSRRRGERSWSPRRRSPSRDRRPRSPTPPPRRSSPHRRSPSAPLPESKSPFGPDNAVDVRHAQGDPSPPFTSPRPPPPIETHTSTPRARLSPQPPTAAPTTTFVLPPHPSLPANPKRSRTLQSSLPNANAGRSSNVKEIVKESLNKEIVRLASLNASQKAATEPLIRAAERSRHELEMSLLELNAAAERRKAAAAQVEEARAGTLGIGGRHDYSTEVPES
ncbi:hypothetical protein EI94DRAFT_1712669 [Lactarius quietus]|nr:hypothetical protein EI94DRAFT_1712669 [Lactarius quietus]